MVWEKTFVAVSVLCGTPCDDAARSLPEGSEHRIGDLSAKLADPRRGARAAVLAQAAQEVVFAVEEMALR